MIQSLNQVVDDGSQVVGCQVIDLRVNPYIVAVASFKSDDDNNNNQNFSGRYTTYRLAVLSAACHCFHYSLPPYPAAPSASKPLPLSPRNATLQTSKNSQCTSFPPRNHLPSRSTIVWNIQWDIQHLIQSTRSPAFLFPREPQVQLPATYKSSRKAHLIGKRYLPGLHGSNENTLV